MMHHFKTTLLRRFYYTTCSHHVLILGGYGSFGKLISQRLSKNPNIQLTIAGRDLQKASQLAQQLDCSHAMIDVYSTELKTRLAELKPDTVIHTCGPYQTQRDYHVAKTCIDIQMNYIDLADSREFVKGISKLDEEAKQKGVVVISGASSVPGMSCVIDHYQKEFSELHEIQHSISPGNVNSPKGIATIKSVLSYCGKPFKRFENGSYKDVYGWMDIHKQNYCGIDSFPGRLVSNCDVPDLDLFVERYPTVKTVKFHAGLELWTFQVPLYVFAYLTKLGLIDNVSKYSELLEKVSRLWKYAGTAEGAMQFSLRGLDHEKKPHQVTWCIWAGSGDGPQIASTPAVVLAEKIARGEVKSGARSCMGVFTLDEVLDSLKQFDIVTYKNGLGSGAKSAIFRKGLGEETFDMLPEHVKVFHAQGGKCKGALKVTRGKSLIANFIADIAGLPKAAESAQVTVENVNDHWIRRFDGKVLSSKWTEQGGLMKENFGLFQIGFQLKPIYKDGKLCGFVHVTKRMYVFHIPLPRFLSIQADGATICHQQGTGWFVDVKISMPIIGQVVRYEGDVYVE